MTPSVCLPPCRRNAVFRRALTTFLLMLCWVAPTVWAELDVERPLQPRAPFAKSLQQDLGDDADTGHIIIKLLDDSGMVVRGGRLAPAASKSRADKPMAVAADDARHVVNGMLDAMPGSRLESLFKVPTPLLEAMRHTGQRNTGEALADLSQFFVLQVADKSAGRVAMEELLQWPGIETVYGQPAWGLPVDIPPTTPDFQNTTGPGQGYQDAAPLGIDIAAAWQRGLTASGVTVVDVESGWNLAHEDLDHLLGQVPPVAMIPPSQWATNQAGIDHGNATLGVLASGINAYGTGGLIPGATIRVAPLNLIGSSTWIGPNAILLATLNLQPGDIILIEAELPVAAGAVPFENNPAEYAVVRQATALGIHVIEPAGNSPNGLSLDVDLAVFDMVANRSKFDRYFRDSGAVLVGAGESTVFQPVPWRPGVHNAYVNSNYGSRVDTYAWGQDVVTLGYGPRFGTLANCANTFDPFPLFPADVNQEYTYCYGGTSSAGAIVAGAAAILEERHRQLFGQPFDVRGLRHHLSLGTPSIGGVGHQPALDYQLDFMDQGGVITHLFEGQNATVSPLQEFGAAVAGAGDFDGDGTPDVIVGVPGFDVPLVGGGGLSQAGRAYVFSGATGDVLLQVDGTAAGDRLGAAVAGGGDADNDGRDDILIGIPGFDVLPLSNVGRVAIYSGLDGTLMTTLDGSAAGEAYGSAIDFVGDFNPSAEPYDDFVIGAPGSNSNGLTGRAVVTNLLQWNLGGFAGSQMNEEFGFDVAAAGDLNLDGIPDILVGAPGHDSSTQIDAGALFVYSGADGRRLFMRTGDKDVTPIGPARYGTSVDNVGDFNGDGVPDIIVGAPESSTIPGGNHGRADLLSGRGTFLASFSGGHARDRFGTSVAGVGDFNGDGYDDVAIGAPTLTGSLLVAEPGRVHVKLGGIPTSDPPYYQERLFWTLDYSTGWGSAVAATGDISGDGLPDLILGEPSGEDGGRAYVVSVAPGPSPSSGVARLTADLPFIEAHDVDGDGDGGGGTSPSTATLILDAGIAWANADYMVVGNPHVGTYLSGGFGQLGSDGRTAAPVFGPISSTLLCSIVGYRQSFLGAAARDLDGDGTYDIYVLSNSTDVEIINEYAPLCQ